MLVAFADRLLRRLGIAGRGRSPKSQSAAISGPASIAAMQPKPVGKAQPNLKARALRLHNRNDRAASIYEARHEVLARGVK